MTYYTIEPALRARVSEADADMATIRRAIGGTWGLPRWMACGRNWRSSYD